MGRKPVNISPVTNERSRHTTFSKRRAGFLKKAYELSVLCDCEVGYVIFYNGKLYQYSSSDMDQLLLRYTEYGAPCESRNDEDFFNMKERRGSFGSEGDSSFPSSPMSSISPAASRPTAMTISQITPSGDSSQSSQTQDKGKAKAVTGSVSPTSPYKRQAVTQLTVPNVPSRSSSTQNPMSLMIPMGLNQINSAPISPFETNLVVPGAGFNYMVPTIPAMQFPGASLLSPIAYNSSGSFLWDTRQQASNVSSDSFLDSTAFTVTPTAWIPSQQLQQQQPSQQPKEPASKKRKI